MPPHSVQARAHPATPHCPPPAGAARAAGRARGAARTRRRCMSARCGPGAAPPPPTATTAADTRTCRRCKRPFSAAANHAGACRFHPALYTGGELGKAIGFCRESDAPEHQLAAVHGRTGLLRFWDCCGAEDEGAPGCRVGRHVSYDDPEED